jgi:hypothetical protein
MIYLYKKTHNETGLQYLGKTIRDPYKYPGSGLYWKSHLKIHGNDVSTEVLFQTEDKEEFKKVAIEYSNKLDIVKSKEWANFREETGNGGFSKESQIKGFKNGQAKRSSSGGRGNTGIPKSEAHKEAISETCRKKKLAGIKGAPKTEAHKEALRETWRKKKLASMASRILR